MWKRGNTEPTRQFHSEVVHFIHIIDVTARYTAHIFSFFVRFLHFFQVLKTIKCIVTALVNNARKKNEVKNEKNLTV